jgi:hypothetical protein
MKYVVKMNVTYERHFGSKPIQMFSSPLEKGDHPEFSSSEFLDGTSVNKMASYREALLYMMLFR